jgi:hypothetical protein
MTEIKLGRTPHSALSIPHLNGSFPEFILGWTIGAVGVWPSRSDVVTIARHFNAGLVVKSIQVPEGRPSLPDEMEGHGGNIVPFILPSLRDLCRCRWIPGVETPGYCRVVPLGRARSVGRAFRMPQGHRVAPTRRTMLGDDGNLMPAVTAADLSRTPHSPFRT